MVEKENEQKQIELLQTIGHPDLDNIVHVWMQPVCIIVCIVVISVLAFFLLYIFVVILFSLKTFALS